MWELERLIGVILGQECSLSLAWWGIEAAELLRVAFVLFYVSYNFIKWLFKSALQTNSTRTAAPSPVAWLDFYESLCLKFAFKYVQQL